MSQLFAKRRQRLLAMKASRSGGQPEPTAGRSVTCTQCKAELEPRTLDKSLYVCPHCGYHLPIGAYYRLNLLLDPASFREIGGDIQPRDVLDFPDYPDKLQESKYRTGLEEAVVCATGKMGGIKIAIGVLDSRFFMGSLSTAVGERLTVLIELATRQKLPLILCSASGGARMQEGILSLMQMAKTAAALERFSQKGGLYISLLTHPTTGGVTASFASLGDIMLAEPGALIGFAGPRVIQQTIQQELPQGFQRSEFLQEKGFLDAVVPRSQLKATLIQLLKLHGKGD